MLFVDYIFWLLTEDIADTDHALHDKERVDGVRATIAIDITTRCVELCFWVGQGATTAIGAHPHHILHDEEGVHRVR